MHLVRQGHRLAAMELVARALTRIADRALVEPPCDHGVGQRAALAHRHREFRQMGDPVVDRARRHGEEAGELVVGRAEQAIVARKLAVLGLEVGGMSGGSHGRSVRRSEGRQGYATTLRYEVKGAFVGSANLKDSCEYLRSIQGVTPAESRD
jgi:hypothetical protein